MQCVPVNWCFLSLSFLQQSEATDECLFELNHICVFLFFCSVSIAELSVWILLLGE